MNAAVFAERVLRDARVERVSRQIVRSAEQRELLTGNDQVQNSFLGAYRAVAIDDGSEIRRDAKSYAPAVTPTFHGGQHRSTPSSHTRGLAQHRPFWATRCLLQAGSGMYAHAGLDRLGSLL